MNGERARLKMSEVALRTGVDRETLVLLAEDGVLHGSVRSTSGHLYLYADAVPAYAEILDLIEIRREDALSKVEVEFQRVDRELEAVRADLALAKEDSRLPLGHDLLTFRSAGRGRGDTTLQSALFRAELALHHLQRYQEALEQARLVRPRSVD